MFLSRIEIAVLKVHVPLNVRSSEPLRVARIPGPRHLLDVLDEG